MQGFLIFAVGIAGRVGTVSLGSSDNVLTDVLVGRVLANELSLAPTAKTAEEAAQVSVHSRTMFDRPQRVVVTLLEGAAEQGAALESDCAPSKECVGETCYGTTAPCVAQRLVSQSRTNLAADVDTAAVTSEALRGAACGGASLVQLGSVAEQASVLTPVADVTLGESRADVSVGGHTASFDTRDVCVQTLFAEASAIVAAVPKKLTLLMPRSGACIQAKFGKGAAETTVATELLARAAATHLGAGTLAVTLRLAVQAEGANELPLPEPSLIQARQLAATPALATVAMYSAVTNYHVYAWTSLAIALSLFAAVYSIISMTNERDPLLYAKYRPEVDPTRRG